MQETQETQNKIFAINTNKYLMSSEITGFEDFKIEGDKITGFLKSKITIIEKDKFPNDNR